MRALRLEEKGHPSVYYLPRNDTDMSLLARTNHYTYCPYKGDCTYYSIPVGEAKSENAAWTYETPYEAVASIRECLSFYPARVDALEVMSSPDCVALWTMSIISPSFTDGAFAT